MSEKKKIIWIDDNEDRQGWKEILEAEYDVVVDFILVAEQDILSTLKEIRKQSQPDLLIIDHILDKSTNPDEIKYGSSAAGILAQEWHCCPIMAITSGDKMDDVIAGSEIYDQFIDFDEEFDSYKGLIPNLADGFPRVKEINDVNSLLHLLDSPDQYDIERLKSCMPHSIKNMDKKDTYVHDFYKWFRDYFYGLPGFLYDKQWVSTVIGVDIEHVEKYIDGLSGSLYKGVFHNPERPRWWKSRIYNQILSVSKSSTCSSIQGKANEFLDVSSDHVSKCHKCGKSHPDIMAYEDELETSELRQMHTSCTEQHSMYNYYAMFEETRVMLSDEEE